MLAKSVEDDERCPLEIESTRRDRDMERRKKILVPCISREQLYGDRSVQ